MILSYDKTEFIYNAYSSVDYNTCIISEENSPLNNNTVTLVKRDDFPTTSYANLKFNDFYYQALGSEKFEIGSNLVVDNDYKDNEIGLTDYLVSQLIEDGKIEDDGTPLGKKIIIDDEVFVISKVYDTNYEWYFKLSVDERNYYHDFYEYHYQNVFTNENTASKIYSIIRNLKEMTIDNYKYLFIKSSDVLDDWYYGSRDISDDEIVLGVNYISLYFNEQFDSDDMDKYIGREFVLSGKTYKIKGILFSNCIAVSDKHYKDIKSEINFTMKGMSVSLTNKDDSIRLINDLNLKKCYLYSPYYFDTLLCLEEFDFFKTASKYIIVIALFMLISSTIFLLGDLIGRNKKQIGVIRSLGVSNKKVGLMLGFEIGKIVLISIIFAVLFYVFYYFKVNLNYVSQTCYDSWLVEFNIVGLGIYLIAVILCVIILFLVFFIKFHRKNIQELLKNR